MLGLRALHVAFRGLPNVEVVAHVDSNPTNIEEKMAYTQARRHYTDYLEMLDKEHPDIVVLCSRHPGDHSIQIKAAAARGCHIYCEKPMTADLHEADQIVELAEKQGIKLCVAHPARYSLPYLTMKAMIDRGDIGVPFTAHGRGKCDHRGGGEDLMVLGTHILDLMQTIVEDRQPVSNAWTARATLEMVYGIYASSLANKEVTLPLVCRVHPLEEGQATGLA